MTVCQKCKFFFFFLAERKVSSVGFHQGGPGEQDPHPGGGQAQCGLLNRAVGAELVQVQAEEGWPCRSGPTEEAGHRHWAIHCVHDQGGGDPGRLDGDPKVTFCSEEDQGLTQCKHCASYQVEEVVSISQSFIMTIAKSQEKSIWTIDIIVGLVLPKMKAKEGGHLMNRKANAVCKKFKAWSCGIAAAAVKMTKLCVPPKILIMFQPAASISQKKKYPNCCLHSGHEAVKGFEELHQQLA